ncbi:MAG: hypothetical protein KAG84_00785 [Bacteroidales bacterium]|nr:hypothetical protein [Bacteroidales bacterium]
MKRFLIPIIILSIYACSNPNKKENKQQSIREQNIIDSLTNTEILDKKVYELKFKEVNGQAVLIGEKIELLDKNLKTIDNISKLSGKIVDIKGVSDSLFNKSKDICDAFWYVKIEIENIIGIVNGRQVFEIQNSNQDTIFIIDSTQIEILTTDFLGMGVDYEGDLMGCPVDQPILIKDTKNNYFGLVDLIQNEYSKKASWDNEYPFFEIRSDDGCYDKIESIIVDGTDIRLKIHRRWQEGENDFEVLLNFADNKYKAEYLNFGEIKYE